MKDSKKLINQQNTQKSEPQIVVEGCHISTFMIEFIIGKDGCNGIRQECGTHQHDEAQQCITKHCLDVTTQPKEPKLCRVIFSNICSQLPP